MGSQVPVWIPIVVALLGLAGVILSQVLAGRREARRSAEEAARDERRWRREREARTHEARAAAYAELLGAIEAFDVVLYRTRRVRESGSELDPVDAAELREVRARAGQSLGAAVLHAPEEVRRLMPDAMVPRMRLSERLLDPRETANAGRTRPDWDAGQRGYRVLRARMRLDLGLDAEELAPPEPDQASPLRNA